jgi:Na+-transporting NADH:ubiquinone oxidoreductase subunit A
MGVLLRGADARHVNKTIKIRQGYDLPLAGAPAASIDSAPPVQRVALLTSDYPGLKPRLLVEPGNRISVGQPLFIDKRDPLVMYTAPASGTITRINRGARRALQSVVIELDPEQPECTDFEAFADRDVANVPTADLCAALYTSGLWSAFRTRPYSRVPQSGTRPHSIFVTAIDTQPLAGNPAVVIPQFSTEFTVGLQILTRLTDGMVHVCAGPDWNGPAVAGERLSYTQFVGPHPAGLPGTHIHHLDPVDATKTVWHIGYQDVIAIGKLLGAGRVWNQRIIALTGAGFKKPRLVETYLGASCDDLTAGELQPDQTTRLISGSVLNGHTAAGPYAFLGRYHLQVTALAERRERRLFGWLVSADHNLSAALPQTTTTFSTAQHGRPTAMIPVQAFDKVLGLDMLAVPLLRALLVKDTDQAQKLGCLELDPEDLALCTFVCPGKNDYGALLQINLDQIWREG